MEVATRPSKSPRTVSTLTAGQLVEEAARREMGARIKDLRERSPWKQPHMADKLGVGLRMYQRIEQRGTTDWERAEQLAEIHDVDPHWIWAGEEKKPTPNLMESFNGGSQEQLDRIEAKLDEILKNWDARWALLEATDAGPESAQAEQQPARESRARHR